jgi:hypothetical protein
MTTRHMWSSRLGELLVSSTARHSSYHGFRASNAANANSTAPPKSNQKVAI